MMPGHLLVATAAHVASTADLTGRRRAAFEQMLQRAIAASTSLGGRPSVAIEHGRSPVCGDPSGHTHAHVHILPTDTADDARLDDTGVFRLLARGERPAGTYVAVVDGASRTEYDVAPGTRHAARTAAAVIATGNGLDWRPLMAPADRALAERTARDARSFLSADPRRRAGATRRADARATPTVSATRRVQISGPSGSGKSSVGAALGRALGVAPIEVGVLLRLMCLTSTDPGVTDRMAAARIWRLVSSERIDFDAIGRLGMAAAIPRLDGRSSEAALWQSVERDRLSELARGAHVQEVLSEVVARAFASGPAVVIGRTTGPPTDAAMRLELTASAAERTRRKRAQLRRVGVEPDAHDWFTPRSPHEGLDAHGIVIDTTHLTLDRAIALASGAALSEPRDGASRHGQAQ